MAMPTSGPLSPVGQGDCLSFTISSGMGMFWGSVLANGFTQRDCGWGSAPPTKPRVIPLSVYPLESGGSPGAGSMSPPAARLKSSAAVVPGEMLDRVPERSKCPSVPSRIGTQVLGSDVNTHLLLLESGWVPVGQGGLRVVEG